MPLSKVCKEEGMPSVATVYFWLRDKKDFLESYTRAKEDQADTLADEIIEIADDGRNDTIMDDEGNIRTDHDVIARSRLRVEARKWVAAKLKPKKYGDRVVQEVSGLNGGPIEVKSVSELTDEQLAAIATSGGG